MRRRRGCLAVVPDPMSILVAATSFAGALDAGGDVSSELGITESVLAWNIVLAEARCPARRNLGPARRWDGHRAVAWNDVGRAWNCR